MNIIERGRRFVQFLRELASRSAWAWRRCPHCGSTDTCKHGFYPRRPWFLGGRKTVLIQRHLCHSCRRTYSEQHALLIRGAWYARDVRRFAIDQWQHGGSSLRRVAEFTRSLLGKQERWQLWRPLDRQPLDEERCYLAASSVHRWLDGAGKEAQKTVEGQLEGVATSGQTGTDGLWARLRGVAEDGGRYNKRVVLALVDSVTGVIWPPVVAKGEEARRAWAGMFARAKGAGLELDDLRGITSDGASGLRGYLQSALLWVNHQRCVWHLWRSLRGELAARVDEAVAGLPAAEVPPVRKAVREELVSLVRAVVDARGESLAKEALLKLGLHRLGSGLARIIGDSLDALFVYLLEFNRGLVRTSPEWYWRDFRLRLSRGRNHGSDERLERAVLVWAIYRNFTPAQWRSERKRKYRHPGLCPLAVAGVPPGEISYLDALAV